MDKKMFWSSQRKKEWEKPAEGEIRDDCEGWTQGVVEFDDWNHQMHVVVEPERLWGWGGRVVS